MSASDFISQMHDWYS